MALTPKQRKAALEKGLSVNLAAADDSKYRSPNPNAATQLFAKPAEVSQSTSSLPSDGLRMSVCINDYIKQTDVAELLRVLPPVWNIRERTLIEIARSFPLMTSLEFRRSLLLLVDQARKSQTAIQNHNAWLKAAFVKNEGPLVTQRMIEAHLDQINQVPKLAQTKRHERQEPKEKGQGSTEEIELLRWYLACGAEERAKIDRSADEKAAPLLTVVAEDKRAGVIEEARREAIREHVAKLTRTSPVV